MRDLPSPTRKITCYLTEQPIPNRLVPLYAHRRVFLYFSAMYLPPQSDKFLIVLFDEQEASRYYAFAAQFEISKQVCCHTGIASVMNLVTMNPGGKECDKKGAAGLKKEMNCSAPVIFREQATGGRMFKVFEAKNVTKIFGRPPNDRTGKAKPNTFRAVKVLATQVLAVMKHFEQHKFVLRYMGWGGVLAMTRENPFIKIVIPE
jgi:hypothetical protein